MKTRKAEQLNNPPTSDIAVINEHSPKHRDNSIVAQCDDAGYARIQQETEEQRVHHIDASTNNLAEYKELISLLKDIPVGCLQINANSQLLRYQFSGDYQFRDPELSKLLSQIHALIAKKRLTIYLEPVPRKKTLFG